MAFCCRQTRTSGLEKLPNIKVSLYPEQPITCTVQIQHVNADRPGPMVLEMSEPEKGVYRAFVQAERASRMEARARAGVC